MKLSCIIVSFNHGKILGECLGALKNDLKGVESEIIIINNSREDRHIGETLRLHPDVRIISNQRNSGFAKANNQAVALSQGEFLLLLNPDAILSPGSVQTLLDFLIEKPDIGVAAPKVLNPDGSLQYSCRRFPTLWTGLFNRYSLLSKCFPDNRFTSHYLMKDFNHSEIREVDWVSGCCMMIPRIAFESVGGFDERFFLFNEDVDLCKMIAEKGYLVCYHPEATVVHQVIASSGKSPWRIIIKRHQGMSYYYRKHSGSNPIFQGCVDMLVVLRCISQLIINCFKQ